jgi:hypothetical protein
VLTAGPRPSNHHRTTIDLEGIFETSAITTGVIVSTSTAVNYRGPITCMTAGVHT